MYRNLKLSLCCESGVCVAFVSAGDSFASCCVCLSLSLHYVTFVSWSFFAISFSPLFLPFSPSLLSFAHSLRGYSLLTPPPPGARPPRVPPFLCSHAPPTLDPFHPFSGHHRRARCPYDHSQRLHLHPNDTGAVLPQPAVEGDMRASSSGCVCRYWFWFVVFVVIVCVHKMMEIMCCTVCRSIIVSGRTRSKCSIETFGCCLFFRREFRVAKGGRGST